MAYASRLKRNGEVAAQKEIPNPLDAHDVAIKTLMYLAENGRTQEIRLDAARELIDRTAAAPHSDWEDD